mmetsp:Transcript_22999/g.46184  ORF Transcript_22999/g.46184 Transcript_22999/m.46184 type:complete len:276 (-) Transcript_22999:136-963(-)|eukprot:CAMPEP_0167821388 /NCGR_PEP_ID=MMETSP0112_2-20121227/6766_1 /TAXON_ID=91324 /ORGANISM="Lotharella globosa, Strain CCCM811" /LENGTH=275 /DNA_ID=CAMNT_0007722345 /DNA_START=73 /DNA_END=903 /DNA_ORIENTATION=-
MALQSSFRREELTDWQKKMGLYVSAIMQDLIDSYELMLEKEDYLENLKQQLEEVKKQVQYDILEEINIRKEGENPTKNFLDKKAEREGAVIRLTKAVERWQLKADDANDRMRRISLLWKQAGQHYSLQMETYKSDEQRRNEKRIADEKRIIDEQMRKIAYDERMMKERAAKLKARMEKRMKKKKKADKQAAKLNKECYERFEAQSFDKNGKLLKNYRKTDVVLNPPVKRDLILGAIGEPSGDDKGKEKKNEGAVAAGSPKTKDTLKSAAKNMGLS